MAIDLYNNYQEKITLTKEQEACLNYKGDKTLMVKGFAGAGKSLVIEAYAKQLLTSYSANKRNKVAIFTFSNTLNSATKEFLTINGENEEYITVTTFSSHIAQVYKACGAPKLKMFVDPLYTKCRNEVIKEALEKHKKEHGYHRFHDYELKFWLEEIDWMKDMNVSTDDLEYYLSLPRKGRGKKVHMKVADRVIAFQIYTLYDAGMKIRKLGDWADYALYITRHLEQIPEEYKFDHILIDEAQDFSLVEMMAAMSFFRKEMVIAMDMNQRIYEKQWSPKLLGIETTTKRLTKSMRTTKQIDNLAETIRAKNDELLNEDDKSIRAIPEKDGPIPKLVHLRDQLDEKKYVIERVKNWLEQDSRVSIGIIASKNSQVELYEKWMSEAGIKHETISKDRTFSVRSPGVKIVNVYNAKGLEFYRVIIPQFIEGNFPYRHKMEDDEEVQLFLSKCRNLVYVAMTRAKFSLTITYSGENGSRFIGEMNPDCYKAEREPITFSSGISSVIKDAKKENNVLLPPTAEVKKQDVSGMDLIKFFKDKNLEVIDKRTSGGCLWVVGDKEMLQPIVKEAGNLFGAYGKFSAGGRTTKQRSGWFTKCKK